MKSLTELYQLHEGYGSDKWSIYLNEYDGLLTSIRNSPINLLEIGVQNGGSIDIWTKYFPLGINFIGCDVNVDCHKLKYDDPRIKIIIGNANSIGVIKEIKNIAKQGLNLIIDDGSHVSKDIIQSFIEYFPLLNDGGMYLIEDLHCSYWESFGGGLYHPYSAIAFLKKLIDVVNYEHWRCGAEKFDVIQKICDHHEIEISDQSLIGIHSVEFINSICVVKKRRKDENLLGKRILAGKKNIVINSPNQSPEKNTIHKINDVRSGSDIAIPIEHEQSTNAWSLSDNAPEKLYEILSERDQKITNLEALVSERDQKITNLEALVSERDQKMTEMKNSLTRLDDKLMKIYSSASWRLTEPLRRIKVRIMTINRYFLNQWSHGKNDEK